MDDLIKRLEALDAPCRDCDAAIFRMLACNLTDHCYEWSGKYLIDANVLPVTASIDAATTLVPDGHSLMLSVGGNSIAQVTDCTGDACTVPADYDGYHKHPAIALCIAALKAKIAEGLTAEPWGSFTFKGWLITSDIPWPEAMLEQCLEMDTGFIVADIGFCDILLIEDGEANTTKEQAFTAVRNYIKETT